VSAWRSLASSIVDMRRLVASAEATPRRVADAVPARHVASVMRMAVDFIVEFGCLFVVVFVFGVLFVCCVFGGCFVVFVCYVPAFLR
jgi:hypothetical protein